MADHVKQLELEKEIWERRAHKMRDIIDDVLCAMVYGDDEYAWHRLPDALSAYRGDND